MEENQAQQKSAPDARARLREFGIGQSVMARNLRPGDPWIPIIVMKLGPVTYMVRTSDGQEWKRHIEQLKELTMTPETPSSVPEDADNIVSARPGPVDATKYRFVTSTFGHCQHHCGHNSRE